MARRFGRRVSDFPAHSQADHQPGFLINLPLIVLAVLSLIAGFINIPKDLGNWPLFADFMHSSLPAAKDLPGKTGEEAIFTVISGAVSLFGIFVIWLFIRRYRRLTEYLAGSAIGGLVHRFWFADWGFDWLYGWILVRPYVWLARIGRNDIVDLFYDALAWFNLLIHRALSFSQSGYVRWYVAGLAIGAAVYLGMAVFL
jgi:NADH-quinone oxidoreductase subunit L